MKSSTKFKKLLKDALEDAEVSVRRGTLSPGQGPPSTYEAIILEGISLALKELEKLKK